MSDITLAILKPDCIRAKQAGLVLQRLEEEGFEIVASKMIKLTPATAGGFYAVHKERPFFNDLVEFMTSGRVMPLVLRAPNAVAKLREVIGATDPAEAAEGTIRKLYASSKQNNVIHASDSDENAQIESGHFFSKAELIANES
jgi:nucleoside-diphosphate kinase